MIVVQAPGSVAADRYILGLNGARHGRVAIAAMDGTEALLPVAGELLAALGKEMPREGFHAKDRERAGIWLQAHAIADVVIQHADLYPDQLLKEIDGLVTSAQATLWVIVDREPRDGRGARMATTSTDVTSWPDFVRRWQEHEERSDDPTDPRDPASGAPAMLAPSGSMDADVMDDAFLTAFEVAVGWGRDRQPRLAAVEGRIRALLEQFDDPRCQLSASSAIKTVLAEYGWELTLTGAAIPTPCEVPVDRAAASLRTYRDPRVTSVGALWTSGLGGGEMRGVTLPAHPMGSPELDRVPLRVDERLIPYVRAQVLARIEAGAGQGDWLLVGERGQLSIRSTESMILSWLQAVDPYATLEDLRARRPPDGRWLQARGIGLRWIPRNERPTPSEMRRTHEDLLSRIELALREPSASECGCYRPHRPATLTLPEWPPVRKHAPPAADHPWAFRKRLATNVP